MRTLRTLNWIFAAYYASAFVLYAVGAYTPSPTTVGVTLILSAIGFAQNASNLK